MMKLRIKIRLCMLRDAISDFFKTPSGKALKSTFLTMLVITAFILLALSEYQLGYYNGVQDIANRRETYIPMCTSEKTEVHVLIITKDSDR